MHLSLALTPERLQQLFVHLAALGRAARASTSPSSPVISRQKWAVGDPALATELTLRCCIAASTPAHYALQGGAASSSESARPTTAATFDSLPHSVHLAILLLVPRTEERVRCCLVSKRWAALLKEPELWADLNFAQTPASRLSVPRVCELARRAQGRLRSLDLRDAEACSYLVGPHAPGGSDALFRALSAQGLADSIQSIFTECSWEDRFAVKDAKQARQLRSLLPALERASVTVDCCWPSLPMIAKALPLSGETILRLRLPTHPPSNRPDQNIGFVRLADAISRGLILSRVDAVEFRQRKVTQYEVLDFCEVLDDCRAEDPAAASRAAQQLAAALADPEHGPRSITGGDPFKYDGDEPAAGCVPALEELCRALTPESRLRELWTFGDRESVIGGAAARELGAALGSGRSRLETLRIDSCALGYEDGCVESVFLLCL